MEVLEFAILLLIQLRQQGLQRHAANRILECRQIVLVVLRMAGGAPVRSHVQGGAPCWFFVSARSIRSLMALSLVLQGVTLMPLGPAPTETVATDLRVSTSITVTELA